MSMSSAYVLPPNVSCGFDTGPNITIWNGMAVGMGFETTAFLVVAR